MPPKKKGPPSKGQRSITMFLAGSPSASKGREGVHSPPTKRVRTGITTGSSSTSRQQQGAASVTARQELPPPSNSAGVETEPPSAAAPPPCAVPPASTSSPAAARQVLQQKLGVTGERAAAMAGAAQTIEPAMPAAGKSSWGQAAGSGGVKLTPLEQQIVQLKQRHPGIMLCLEVGYKFKFFGADAEAAARELGIYAFQDRAFLTAGFPTHRLHYHVRRLVLAGHKVGVVRQVETAAIKKAGDNRAGPFERRLTALYTKATLEAGDLGGLFDDDGRSEECGDGEVEAAESEQQQAAPSSLRRPAVAATRQQQRQGWHQQQQAAAGPNTYLVCCVEEPVEAGSDVPSQVDVGLVAVEPSTGTVLHAQFRDGLMRQELESKLLFASPAEILMADPASVETRRLMGAIGERLGAAPRLETVPASRYRLASSALDAVQGFYGSHGSGSGLAAPEAAPAVGATASGAAEPAPAAAIAALQVLPPLVLRALAHLLEYLRPFGLEAVLRLGATFQPWNLAQGMRLSANTLRQLEIFKSSDGSPRGSLVGMMDHTKTKFGRRLLYSWVGKPLRQRSAILARLDAVQELAEHGEDHPVLSRLTGTLQKLPDLERGITRAFHATIRPSELAALLQQFSGLHEQLRVGAEQQAAQGCSSSSSIAVATEGAEGSEAATVATLPASLQGVQSPLLQRLLAAAADVSVVATADQMLASMDLQAAAANDKANALKPSDRFPEVLRLRVEAASAERELDDLLPQYRHVLQISNLQFVSLQNQGEYLVEVPTGLVRHVPKDWEKVSSVKKAVRYYPPEVKAGLQRLALAREHLKAACDAAWRQFLCDFGVHYLRLRTVVAALAALDCLCGLAALASSPGYCRPELAEAGEPAQLLIEAGRHPVLELVLEGQGRQFVPNNTHLRGDAVHCQIITGPNMGGKSCYSRQCALIAIMAQVGSYVPAAAVRLRPMDAVLTRMGASDSLALGRSTFAEELGETSGIVSSATSASLVILDELGRGTSTGDGAAIAEATLRHLVERVQPLALFITHYPEVCFRLQQVLPKAVACYRMAHVEEDGLDVQQQQQEQQHAALGRVVFLFKLVSGVAPASFGINVARMAQLPPSVLLRAAQVAERVQHESERRRQPQQQAAEQPAAGAGGDLGSGSSEEWVVQLARQCQQFVQRSLAAGQVDVEVGRQLQEQASVLLAA